MSKFLSVLVLGLKVLYHIIVDYRNEKKMRAKLLKSVDDSTKKFSKDVASGNEDDVSKSVSELLNTIEFQEKRK